MSKILIYGCGAFALALASVLIDNQHEVLLYGRNIDSVKEINEEHLARKYLGDIKLNTKIVATNSFDNFLDFNIVLLAIPSKGIKEALLNINKIYKNKKILIINAIKGLEPTTNCTIQEFIFNHIDKSIDYKIVSILGPGFAKNIILKDLTALNAISKDINVAIYVQSLFSNDYFRVYVLDDVIGSEYSSSIKNAIAIASGILEGLGYKENARCALITRGLNELTKFGLFFGAKKDTFFGLTGIGDLILTCSSSVSRNFSFGYQVGVNDDALKVINNNQKTVEGLNVIKVIYEISLEKEIEMPIINALYKICYEYNKPSLVVKTIMSRPLKLETFNF